MDVLPKIGMNHPVAPLPARSPLIEIYSRRPYQDETLAIPQDDDDQSQRVTEEGKGRYVDIYV
jgi:hypothetical protein